jgi:hypothetical protein
MTIGENKSLSKKTWTSERPAVRRASKGSQGHQLVLGQNPHHLPRGRAPSIPLKSGHFLSGVAQNTLRVALTLICGPYINLPGKLINLISFSSKLYSHYLEIGTQSRDRSFSYILMDFVLLLLLPIVCNVSIINNHSGNILFFLDKHAEIWFQGFLKIN